jgi:hypothetical protein
MSDEALVNYARDLAAEVEESIQGQDGAVYSEEEFTRLVLDKLGDDGALDNPMLLYQEGTFGSTKYKITGFSIPDTEDRLLLVTTVHTGELPPRDLTHEEIQTAVTRAANFYKCSCDGLYARIDPSNTEASDLAQRISEIHDRIEVLRVVLISDGRLGLRPPLDIKDIKDGTRVLVDLYGIERLHRLLGEGLTRDDITLNVVAETGAALPCLKTSGTDADYDAYMTAIPAALLADIYEKYGTRLLELNVRAFLGVRGRKAVNAGLRHTILEEPSRFLAYNNGIVATADDIDVTSDGQGNFAISSLRGLQIVNGGQTTASLHRARRIDKADLSAIAVPAKIIKVKGESLDAMVVAVSRSANSQNTVQPADFSANDPLHVAVEALANNTWLPDQTGRWFYERARGSYGASEFRASLRSSERRRFASETPKQRRFSKTDLAKYLNAWDGSPHLVSYGSQKNFQHFMQSLKDEHGGGLIPDERWYKNFVAKAIIFRSTQDVVKDQKFPAYQAIISAYTVSCLAQTFGERFDLDLVWSRQSISPELKSSIKSWTVSIDKALRRSAGGRMPSEWAKKVECWDSLKEIRIEPTDPMPLELQASPKSTRDAIEAESFEQAEVSDTDRGIDSLILRVRPLFGRSDAMTKDELVNKLSELLGYSASEDKAQDEIENLIRAASRRCIVQEEDGGYALVSRAIADYPREVLKEQFFASLNGSGWIERSEAIPRFARWLGFKRTGPNIEDAARSAINSLIRNDRLERMGSQIRRKG